MDTFVMRLLCFLLVITSFSGCDKLPLPKPETEPEPEPIVQKSIVADVDTVGGDNNQQLPAKTGDPIADFLAKQNYQRNDADLELLAGLPEAASKFNELDLSNSAVTNQGLLHLQAFSSLQAVNLSKTRITDAGVEALSKVTSLENVNVSEAKGVGDAGVASLAKLPRLHSLTLVGTPITDASFEALAEAPELETLIVDGNANLLGQQFSEAVKAKHYASLKGLSVRGTQFGYYGLSNIGLLKNLQVLQAGNCNVTDTALENIQGCTELRRLDLSNSGLSLIAIKKITQLKKLEQLDFSESKLLNDEAFNVLKSMKQLKVLNVTNTSVTEDAVKQLKKSFLTETVILFDGKKY